jgi:hypothetical protein
MAENAVYMPSHAVSHSFQQATGVVSWWVAPREFGDNVPTESDMASGSLSREACGASDGYKTSAPEKKMAEKGCHMEQR